MAISKNKHVAIAFLLCACFAPLLSNFGINIYLFDDIEFTNWLADIVSRIAKRELNNKIVRSCKCISS